MASTPPVASPSAAACAVAAVIAAVVTDKEEDEGNSRASPLRLWAAFSVTHTNTEYETRRDDRDGTGH